MNGHTHGRKRLFWLRQITQTLLLICLILLMLSLTVQHFHIKGHSMEPTIHDQEYMLVNKAAYLFALPARGDIIVFHNPENVSEDYVKRIIALPGDVVSVVDQTVTINGVVLSEKYLDPENAYNPYPPLQEHTVGPAEYFVMGDNRNNSSDSRSWGLLPGKYILGKAVGIYWPFTIDNFGLLPDASSVFANVPTN